MNNFFKFEGNNLFLNVLGQAGAKKDAIGNILGEYLKIYVKKNPENGEATEYMRKFIAGNFGVSLKNVELVYGETSKFKVFKIINPLVIPEKLKKYIEI